MTAVSSFSLTAVSQADSDADARRKDVDAIRDQLKKIELAWKALALQVGHIRLNAVAWESLCRAGLLKDFTFETFKNQCEEQIGWYIEGIADNPIQGIVETYGRIESRARDSRIVPETDISGIAKLVLDYLPVKETGLPDRMEIQTAIGDSFAEHETDALRSERVVLLRERIERAGQEAVLAPCDQTAINIYAWHVAGRPSPQKQFSAQRHVAGLMNNRPALSRFYTALEDRERTLELLSVFSSVHSDRDPYKAITLFLKNIHNLASRQTQHTDKLELRLQSATTKKQQQLVLETARVMRGGRTSFNEAGGHQILFCVDLYKGGPIDPFFDKAAHESLGLLGKNYGCLLPTDEDRQAIHNFLKRIARSDEKGNILPENIPDAYRQLKRSSPSAAHLLTTVFHNFFTVGDDYRFIFDSETLIMDESFQRSYDGICSFIPAGIAYCAHAIDQFENHGQVVQVPTNDLSYFSPKRKEFFVAHMQTVLRGFYREKMLALAGFVASCKADKVHYREYGQLGKHFKELQKKAPDVAKDLAEEVRQAHPGCEISGLTLIQITNRKEIIDKVIQLANQMVQKQEAILKRLDESEKPASRDFADSKSNQD